MAAEAAVAANSANWLSILGFLLTLGTDAEITIVSESIVTCSVIC